MLYKYHLLMQTTRVTDGIKISVDTEYQPLHSNPAQEYYLFSYRVRIENHSAHTVQLVTRKWYITDSSGESRVVEGEGVVGVQPVIGPGEFYEYDSACNFRTEMGKMHGYYNMERNDGQRFLVNIPEFRMIVPYKLN